MEAVSLDGLGQSKCAVDIGKRALAGVTHDVKCARVLGHRGGVEGITAGGN